MQINAVSASKFKQMNALFHSGKNNTLFSFDMIRQTVTKHQQGVHFFPPIFLYFLLNFFLPVFDYIFGFPKDCSITKLLFSQAIDDHT